MRATAPGHVAAVRRHVVDALTPEQVDQLTVIADAILGRVDPAASMAAMYRRYDAPPDPPGPQEPRGPQEPQER